jgi:phenylalanyl-tRNA synthetase alpha chain
MPKYLSQQAVNDALTLRDMTNPRQGRHAIQDLLNNIHRALAATWNCNRQVIRSNPVVTLEDNYDRLGYAKDGASRDERYTRYIAENLIFRTQTSSAVPDALLSLSTDPPADILLVFPGLVYRRDSIDKLHCGEPHQLDLWRVTSSAMTTDDLEEMISVVMRSALPEHQWRTVNSPHPYTESGVQIDVALGEQWIEVGECGIASKQMLNNAGLPTHSGLAMGLGLDRLFMLRKGIADIRLIRSTNTKVSDQMLDLAPYKPVSAMPAIVRDLSLCVDQSVGEEEMEMA